MKNKPVEDMSLDELAKEDRLFLRALIEKIDCDERRKKEVDREFKKKLRLIRKAFRENEYEKAQILIYGRAIDK